MAGSNRATNPSRSWRAEAEKSSASSVWLQRVIVTLFGLALLVGFVLLLIYFFLSRAPDVHFVTLRISEYNLQAAPPIPYAAADHEALAAVTSKQSHTHLHRIDATESVTSLKNLAEVCDQVPASGVLIVYLTAHGVSIDDQAWLLASNYQPESDSTTGRIALSDVLKTMREAPARQKLLVLDTGHLEQLPAQGLWVNEFPRLVERDVKALSTDQQAFYVLLPNRFLERAAVSPREQRSSFNYYFVQGWTGAADKPDEADEKLTLGEWFAYTRDKTSAWVWNASGKTSQQTPTLLRAGSGEVAAAAADDLLLRRIPRPAALAKQDDKQESKPAEGQPEEKKATARSRSPFTPTLAALRPALFAQAATDNKQPADKPAPEQPAAATPPATTPIAATSQPAPMPQPPPEPQLPPDDATTQPLADVQARRKTLEEIWFGSSGKMPEWTPADFAPQVWRQLERQNQSYERAALAGAAGTARGQQQDERRATEELRAWHSLWLRSPGVTQLPEHAALREAIVARDRSLLQLAELLRLSTYRPVDGWPSTHPSQIDRLLQETAALDRALANPLALDENGRLVGQAGATPVLLGEAARRLEQLRTEVLTTTIAPRNDARLANPLLVELLHSPLLNDLQRGEARAAWRQRLALLPLFDAPDLRRPEDKDVADWRAKRAEQLVQQVSLTLNIAQAVVRDLPPEVVSLLANYTDLRTLAKTDIAVLNQCGTSLDQLRDKLLAEVSTFATAAPATTEQLLIAERIIRWQAESDAGSIRPAWTKILNQRQYAISAPVQKLALTGPVNVTTTTDGAIPLAASGSAFTWQVGPAAQLPPQTVLRLEYDEKLLQVEQADGRQLPSRGSVTIRAADKTGDDVVTLVLRVAPRPGEESGKQAALKFSAVGGVLPDVTTTFQLPEPKWLELFVRAWPGTVAELTPQATADAEGLVAYQGAVAPSGYSKVILQPFPSGSSPYALRVGNRAQKPRKVTFRTWTVPHDAQRSSLVPWEPWGASGELSRDAVPLSEQTLEIPASGTLDLSLFAPPATPPANPPAPGAPMPPAPPPAAAPAHVEQGILCEFTSADGVAPQRLWLDVAPLHPSQYIDVSFTPNTTNRRLTANVALLSNGAHRNPTHQCEVRWENLAAAHPLLPVGSTGTRDLLAQPLTLSEPLAPGEDSATVVLSVDGYPRAFEYRAPLFGKAERVQANRNNLRLFLLTKDKEQKPVVITERNRYFKTLDDVDFCFQADVPPRGFSADHYQFRVYIDQATDAGGQGIETSREYAADRDFEVELSKAEAPTPRFVLRTKVDDLRGTLRLAGLTNRVVPIKAEIRRRDRSGQQQGSTLHVSDFVVLDTLPPELVSQPREQSVTIGEPFRLAVKINDRVAGVRSADWSFQLDAQGNLKEPQPLEMQSPAVSNPAQTPAASEATLELPTQEWKPGTRKIYVQATDKAGNNNAEPWAFPIKVIAPVGEPMTVKKETNSLLVYVRFRGEGIEDTKVTISGPESRTGKTNGKGLARFDDLPPGEYTASLSMPKSVNNVRREAEPAKATVAAPPKPPAEAELNLK